MYIVRMKRRKDGKKVKVVTKVINKDKRMIVRKNLMWNNNL